MCPIDPLEAAITTLSELATPAELAAVESVRDRLRGRRLRVLVAGEAKRGKSTLVNRLLGQEVLPTGVVPVTAIATTVRRLRDSPPGAARVLTTFADGRREQSGLATLPGLVTEQDNPHNVKGVRAVEVLLGRGRLAEYDVELVDTPGTGSVFTHNTATARQAYAGLDAAIVVVSADPPISAAEQCLLREIAGLAVHTMVFLNKTDRLTGQELEQALAFTKAACAQAIEQQFQLFAGSARVGLVDPGFARFAVEFEDYLTARAHSDLQRALTGHVRRLATGLLDAARLAEHMLQLTDSRSRQQLELFTAELTRLREQQDDLDNRGWAVEHSLRRELDASAAELVDSLVPRCVERVSEALAAELADADADEIDRVGRLVAVTLITAAVDGWRDRQAAALDAGLAQLCRRIAAEHERQLTELQNSARELLDIELSIQSQPQWLAPSRGFWYQFDRPVSVEPPLAATARRLAPGSAHRAGQRLLRELPTLADRQVGRARADLQGRLREGMRALLADLRRAHELILDRLQLAVATVDRTRQESLAGQRTTAEQLGDRIRLLTYLVNQLTGPVPTGKHA